MAILPETLPSFRCAVKQTPNTHKLAQQLLAFKRTLLMTRVGSLPSYIQ